MDAIWTTTTLDVDGGTLALHTHGTDGPTVLLLHGGGLDHRMWTPLAQVLGDGVRLVAPDARSHGASSTARAPFRHCDDVVAVLEHLGASAERPAVVVGVSMGGAAGLEAALLRPDLVRRLVSCGAGATEMVFEDPWTVERQAELAALAAAGDPAGWVRAWTDTFLVGRGRDRADLPTEVVEVFTTMVRETVSAHVRPDAVVPDPLAGAWERLGELEVPVVGAVGEVDLPDHHRAVERLVALVPGARHVVLPRVGHHAPLEDPQGFARFLRDDVLAGAGSAA